MGFIVSLISLVLIGTILWWFFGKHEKTKVNAELANGVQKISITVDGGYKPEIVRLKKGIPAELTFLRKTSSGCFDEVVLPDFGKQAKLPIDKPYVIKINPEKSGMFKYSCGMHMFFGQIEVV